MDSIVVICLILYLSYCRIFILIIMCIYISFFYIYFNDRLSSPLLPQFRLYYNIKYRFLVVYIRF